MCRVLRQCTRSFSWIRVLSALQQFLLNWKIIYEISDIISTPKLTGRHHDYHRITNVNWNFVNILIRSPSQVKNRSHGCRFEVDILDWLLRASFIVRRAFVLWMQNVITYCIVNPQRWMLFRDVNCVISCW